jgi:tRNA dimethylallyltransferase
VTDRDPTSAAPVVSAFFLVGPTAVGKTALAHAIARAENMEVLSADAMLVYRGMNIGTAKPGPAEQAEVRYHGIDLAEPDEAFSLGRYLDAARAAVRQAAAAGRRLLVVGGTGLYIKGLAHGLADEAADPGYRRELEELLARQGVEALQRLLQERDAGAWARLADPRNPRRLIRALERARGEPAGARPEWPRTPDYTIPGLNMAPALLYDRMVARVERMYAQGLLDEVKRLNEQYSELSPTARRAIGYGEAAAVLEGRMSLDAARQQTIQRTRQLARRQLTWFRHQVHVDWIEATPDHSAHELARRVRESWNRHGQTPLGI